MPGSVNSVLFSIHLLKLSSPMFNVFKKKVYILLSIVHSMSAILHLDYLTLHIYFSSFYYWSIGYHTLNKTTFFIPSLHFPKFVEHMLSIIFRECTTHKAFSTLWLFKCMSSSFFNFSFISWFVLNNFIIIL